MESISEVRSSEGKGSSNYEFFEKFQIKPVGNGEIMLNKFHRDQMNGSLFKIGGTNYVGFSKTNCKIQERVKPPNFV